MSTNLASLVTVSQFATVLQLPPIHVGVYLAIPWLRPLALKSLMAEVVRLITMR